MRSQHYLKVCLKPLALDAKAWVLPRLCNSRILFVLYLYIALNTIPSIDCYRVGAVPNPNPGLKARLNLKPSTPVLGFGPGWLGQQLD